MKAKIFLVVFSAILILSSFQLISTTDSSKIEEGMVKISILYPNEEGKTFDMDYYAKNHMPMCAKLFGEPLKGYAIDKGIAGRTPEEPVPYVAIGYFYFNTLSEYNEAFGPNAEKILGDIPNYTDIQPVIQISEVIK